MPREALIRHCRVGRRHGAIVAEGVEPRQGAAGEGAALPQPGDVAQVVGEGEIELARAAGAGARLDGHDLPGQPVGRAEGVGARARRVGQFVVGEGRVDDCAVGIGGHDPLAAGVVGERRRRAAADLDRRQSVFAVEDIQMGGDARLGLRHQVDSRRYHAGREICGSAFPTH
jgi:hypothetical protein